MPKRLVTAPRRVMPLVHIHTLYLLLSLSLARAQSLGRGHHARILQDCHPDHSRQGYASHCTSQYNICHVVQFDGGYSVEKAIRFWDGVVMIFVVGWVARGCAGL